MAIAAERELHPAQSLAVLGELGWLAVVGGASLGAGAIHAAAIGVHSEHRQAVIAFTVVAAIQLGFGAVALARPGRSVLALGALANAGIIGGWVLAKTNGISFVDGLDVAEPVQTADGLAAGLAGRRGAGRSSRRSSGWATTSCAAARCSPAARRCSSRPSRCPACSRPGPCPRVGRRSPRRRGSGPRRQRGTARRASGARPGVGRAAQALRPRPAASTWAASRASRLQQQAAAENLLAITILQRLPKFSDPLAVAEHGVRVDR